VNDYNLCVEGNDQLEVPLQIQHFISQMYCTVLTINNIWITWVWLCCITLWLAEMSCVTGDISLSPS